MEDFMGNFILFMFILVILNLGFIVRSLLLANESWDEIIITNVVLSVMLTLLYWTILYDIELHILSFLVSCFVLGVMTVVLYIIRIKYKKYRKGATAGFFMTCGVLIFTIVKYIFKIKLFDCF